MTEKKFKNLDELVLWLDDARDDRNQRVEVMDPADDAGWQSAEEAYKAYREIMEHASDDEIKCFDGTTLEIRKQDPPSQPYSVYRYRIGDTKEVLVFQTGDLWDAFEFVRRDWKSDYEYRLYCGLGMHLLAKSGDCFEQAVDEAFTVNDKVKLNGHVVEMEGEGLDDYYYTIDGKGAYEFDEMAVNTIGHIYDEIVIELM